MIRTWLFNLLNLSIVLILFPSLGVGRTPLSAVSDLLTFIEAEVDNGLNAAYSVAVSPDGDHVYVAGYEGDAVVVFSRDGSTGTLAFVETHKDTDPGMDGLHGAASVAMSPDGNHVYVAGYLDSAVVVWNRDGSTGELSYVEVHKDGDPGIFYLDGARSVTVSPDGKHVYVGALTGNAVSTFSRDGSTGALSYVSAVIDGVGDVDGLNGITSVTISPDGGHVYVSSSIDNAVAVFSRDGSTGKLTFVEAHKDTDPGVDGLDNARSVAVSPDGNHVYVAGRDDDAVVVFSRNGSTGELTFVAVYKDSDPVIDALNGANSIATSPDGDHVYVASFLYDAVAMFSRDTSTGELSYVGRRQNHVGGVEGLWGAYSVAVSPDGGHAYVGSYLDDAVVVFGRDGSTGKLTFVHMQEGVDGLNGVVEVAVSPDGAHLYATGNYDDAVAVFSRDGVTGALTFEEVYKDSDSGLDGLDGARSVAMSPDGSHVYVASFMDDAVAVFSRDGSTGELTYVEVHKDIDVGVDGLNGIQSLSTSPDGDHVYTAAYLENAVAVFSRDESSGALTFVEVYKDTDPGMDGLSGAYSIAFSPDGNYAYVAGIGDDSVAVFSRNEASGALTFVEVHKDADPGMDGLDGANSVAVSPDGNHVYVAGRNDDALVVFSRNESTGALTFVELQQDDVGGVDGLNGATSVAIAPDGGYVYVASHIDNAVAVFSRDESSGALTFVGARKNTDADVEGLNNANAVAVSPDGSSVYVAGLDNDTIAVFSHRSFLYLPLVLRDN